MHVCCVTSDGNMWHTIRFQGSWQPSFGNVKEATSNPGIFRRADCSVRIFDNHFCGITENGDMWHTIRTQPFFSWQPFFGNVKGATGTNPGTFRDVSCASDGMNLHVCGVTEDGNMWHTIRLGEDYLPSLSPLSWRAFFNVKAASTSNPGIFSRVSCAMILREVTTSSEVDAKKLELHVCGVTEDGNMWHTIGSDIPRIWEPKPPFTSSLSWRPFVDVKGATSNPGAFQDVACASVGGNLHICGVTRDGNMWHTIRFQDGSWQPSFGDVKGATSNPGAFQDVACAKEGENLHVCGVTEDGNLWHTIRFQHSWQPFFGNVKVAVGKDPGHITNVGISTDPLKNRTSWIAENLDAKQVADNGMWLQSTSSSIWVDEDSTIFANGLSDERSSVPGVYDQDNKRIGHLGIPTGYPREHPTSHFGGMSIAGDDKYVYAFLVDVGDESDKKDENRERRDYYRVTRGILARYDKVAAKDPANLSKEHPETQPDRVVDSIEGSLLGVVDEVRPLPYVTGLAAGSKSKDGERLLYVSFQDYDRVVVFNADTMMPTGRSIPVTGAAALTVDHVTGHIWVVSRGLIIRAGFQGQFESYSAALYKIDANDKVVRRVLGPRNPTALAIATIGWRLVDLGHGKIGIAGGTRCLLVADDAPTSQQVLVFEAETGKPRPLDNLGQPGGVIAAKGEHAPDRFDGPVGLGVDGQQRIFVASNGRGLDRWGRWGHYFDVRGFAAKPSTETEEKRSYELFFHLADYTSLGDVVVPDPEDENVVYSVGHRFTLDYTKNADETHPEPATEWTDWRPGSPKTSPKFAAARVKRTIDRFRYPDDGRALGGGRAQNGGILQMPIAVRHLKDPSGRTRRYLYVIPGGAEGQWVLAVYRFDETGYLAQPTALMGAEPPSLIKLDTDPPRPWPPNKPSLFLDPEHKVPANSWTWRDADNDGQMKANGYQGHAVNWSFWGRSVGENGELWAAVRKSSPGAKVGGDILYIYPPEIDAAGTLDYDLDYSKPIVVKDPPGVTLTQVYHLRYVPETDTMYLQGSQEGAGDQPLILARYNDFRKNYLADPPNPQPPAWVANVHRLDPTCDSEKRSQLGTKKGRNCLAACPDPASLAVAGDRVYVGYQYSGWPPDPVCEITWPSAEPGNGRIDVFDAASGVPLGKIMPGPEVGPKPGERSGWFDEMHAINALQRSDGTRVVFAEEIFNGRILLYHNV